MNLFYKPLFVFTLWSCLFTPLFAQQTDSLWEVRLNEITVTTPQGYASSSFKNAAIVRSADDALQQLKGVQLFKRGGFAWEPTVKGYQYGQVSITIDGMKMEGACVDRMDPSTAYFDVENLKSVELSSDKIDLSAGANIGGVLNMRLRNAEMSIKPKTAAMLSNTYEVGNRLFIHRGTVNHSNKKWGLRLSWSTKQAGDYLAGNGQRINASSYHKYNTKIDFSIQLKQNHKLDVGALMDYAKDVGYPALIMDATKAVSNLVYAKWQWDINEHNRWTNRLYHSQVLHWMDDYKRSLSEIRNRVVMPDMYMPMYGDSRTIGLISKWQYHKKSSVLSLNYDGYYLNNYADMKMESIFDNVPDMFMLNIGNLHEFHHAIATQWVQALNHNTDITFSNRLEWVQRYIADSFGEELLQAYWDKKGDIGNIYYMPFNSSISISNNKGIGTNNSFGTSLKMAYVSRIPNRYEAMGYYLYVPTDNAIIMGNPSLGLEKALQLELGFNLNFNNRSTLEVEVYHHWIRNYIGSEVIQEADPTNKQFSQSFERFSQLGDAKMYGAFIAWQHKLSGKLGYQIKTNYTYGQALDYGTPLPFISPLSVENMIHYQDRNKNYNVALFLEYHSKQDRVSALHQLENETEAYALVHIRAEKKLGSNKQFIVRAGIENILDKVYTTHLSINDLKATGRNVFINVVYEF